MAAKTVLKWPVVGKPWIDLPVGAVIVHFATQEGVPTIWVETDAYPAGRERRYLAIFGTGMVVPDGAVHRGTCLDGIYVWHLYETTGL